jgi:CBS domain-containing protein
MRIAALLEAKGTAVATIGADATVADAVVALCRQRIGALVVSSDGRHIEGIVSERDVIRGLNDLGGAIMEQSVSSVMSTTVHTCSPDDDTDSLMSTMTEQRVRHVPVVSDGELAGIVSIGDVVKSRIDELQTDRDKLVEYINAR